ncbi:YcbK family protein [Paraburkholderia sediminicola]|uniref:YcbK family protein n=1 Tax=Paraburkholderia sediminicola TaxID=458836 RepID=UPI0038BBCA7D
MSTELLRSRREFLKRSISTGIVAMGAMSFANPLRAATGLVLPQYYADGASAEAFWAQPRVLNLYRPATGEHRELCFWRDGHVDQGGYAEVCHMLRDVRADVTVPMDLRLLNLLRGIQGWLQAAYGITGPYRVNSGFRSEETNALTEGAVKDSLHKRGMAVDGSVPGLPVEYVGQLFAAFQGGGVGFYVNRQRFIHSDVGRVRYWVR